jgi:hypothetical protein
MGIAFNCFRYFLYDKIDLKSRVILYRNIKNTNPNITDLELKEKVLNLLPLDFPVKFLKYPLIFTWIIGLLSLYLIFIGDFSFIILTFKTSYTWLNVIISIIGIYLYTLIISSLSCICSLLISLYFYSKRIVID